MLIPVEIGDQFFSTVSRKLRTIERIKYTEYGAELELDDGSVMFVGMKTAELSGRELLIPRGARRPAELEKTLREVRAHLVQTGRAHLAPQIEIIYRRTVTTARQFAIGTGYAHEVHYTLADLHTGATLTREVETTTREVTEIVLGASINTSLTRWFETDQRVLAHPKQVTVEIGSIELGSGGASILRELPR